MTRFLFGCICGLAIATDIAYGAISGQQRDREVVRLLAYTCGYAWALADVSADSQAGDICQEARWLATKWGVPRVHAR